MPVLFSQWHFECTIVKFNFGREKRLSNPLVRNNMAQGWKMIWNGNSVMVWFLPYNYQSAWHNWVEWWMFPNPQNANVLKGCVLTTASHLEGIYRRSVDLAICKMSKFVFRLTNGCRRRTCLVDSSLLFKRDSSYIKGPMKSVFIKLYLLVLLYWLVWIKNNLKILLCRVDYSVYLIIKNFPPEFSKF